MKGPKVVIIGAGSLFFSQSSIIGFSRSKTFSRGELCLVDSDKERLRIIEKFAHRVIEILGANLTVKATTVRKEVLPGADFVILTFANRGTYFRGLDCRLANKYGIRMCSGDTTGPGGIFRTLRVVPTVLKIAKDIEEVCPNAWVINYTNPTATIGIALNRYSKLKTIALCDGQEMPQFKDSFIRWCNLVQRDKEIDSGFRDSVRMKVGGVNHFTWMVALKQDGKDLFPTLRSFLIEHKEEEQYRVALQLFDAFGCFPTVIRHTIEYLPFFQGKGFNSVNSYIAKIWDEEARWKWLKEFWQEMKAYAEGSKNIMEVIKKKPTDLCVRITEAILTNANEIHFVNIPNQGTITNLPQDAVLELAAKVGSKGCRPLPFGDFPRGLLGITHQVLDSHELAVEAAVTGLRSTLLKAFLADPIVFSIENAKSLIEEMLEAEKDALPAIWRKGNEF